jgi:ParB family transcriptional regulator, chromosome partitioning protein
MTTSAAEKIEAETGAGLQSAAPAESEKHVEKVVEKRRALGRGLDSLLPSGGSRERGGTGATGGDARASTGLAEPPSAVIAEIHAQAVRPAPGESVIHIPLDKIDANPYQTRVEFNEEMLQELRDSIRATGVVQPIIVRPVVQGRYVLVLGERRCRASKMAGKETIPAIVRRCSDQQAAEMTVVENLQRQDLNCMEQAAAFSKLSREFGLTQEQIGNRVGLARESVSNYMRLLRLPGTVMQYLYKGLLGFSEARELLKLDENDLIAKIADQAVDQRLSLYQLMDLIEDVNIKRNLLPQPAQPRGARWVDPNVRAAQTELERILGVRVKIRDRKGKGKIVIEYSNLDDYERVVEMLRGRA